MQKYSTEKKVFLISSGWYKLGWKVGIKKKKNLNDFVVKKEQKTKKKTKTVNALLFL